MIMDYKNLASVTGTIVNMNSMANDCCGMQITLRTEEGIVNLIVDGNTGVIDNRRLRTGMRVAAFYDVTLPVPMIFPPRYRAVLVTVLGQSQKVLLSFFDENLIAENGELQLNLRTPYNIFAVNGQKFLCGPENQTLLVYYSLTTRSIPPQTTPDRMIAFC